MKANATKIPRESTPYITLFTARSRIFLPAAILRVALSWPPRKPTVFVRLARWQLGHIHYVHVYTARGETISYK